MIQQINNIKYYYDSSYDSLNIYLGRALKFYSCESNSGIYLIKEENSDRLIGVEILDFSLQDVALLKKSIPIKFDYEKILNSLSKENLLIN